MDAGYFENLVHLEDLPMYWTQLAKDFPQHPAVSQTSDFIDVPLAIYGTLNVCIRLWKVCVHVCIYARMYVYKVADNIFLLPLSPA